MPHGAAYHFSERIKTNGFFSPRGTRAPQKKHGGQTSRADEVDRSICNDTDVDAHRRARKTDGKSR